MQIFEKGKTTYGPRAWSADSEALGRSKLRKFEIRWVPKRADQ